VQISSDLNSSNHHWLIELALPESGFVCYNQRDVDSMENLYFSARERSFKRAVTLCNSSELFLAYFSSVPFPWSARDLLL
jgi:hypothetical protein